MEECIPPSRLQKRRDYRSGCSTKKVLSWLSDSELKKVSRETLTKTVFQSSLVLILLNWGLTEECIPPSRFLERRNY